MAKGYSGRRERVMGMIALLKIVRVNKKNRFDFIFVNDKNKASYIKEAKYQAFQAIDYQAHVHMLSMRTADALCVLGFIEGKGYVQAIGRNDDDISYTQFTDDKGLSIVVASEYINLY